MLISSFNLCNKMLKKILSLSKALDASRKATNTLVLLLV